MKAILSHIDQTVRPALRAYLNAEKVLTTAQADGDSIALDAARGDVMRTARTAATELHHLADFALHNGPPHFADISEVRAAVQAKVQFLRESKAPVPDDVTLLRDTAEAFKHFKLNRPSATVTDANAVAAISTGYGVARWGEGKWGGAEQCMVTRKNGDKRAMTSLLQNVFDAWLVLLGEPLAPIGEY
jgi:hypothetical protein